MSILTLIVLEFVFTIYFAIYKNSVPVILQDRPLTINEGEEAVFFVPCSPEELEKIDVGNNIVKLTECASDVGILNLNVIQNGKSCISRKLNLCNTFEYEILLNNDELSKVGGCSGLYIFVKVNSISRIREIIEFAERNVEESVSFVKFLEVSDGTLILNYKNIKFVQDKRDARSFLRTQLSSGRKSISFYDLLLQRVFESCPDDKKSVYQINGSKFPGRNQVDNLWINKPDGRMALFILSNFPPDQIIIGRSKIFGGRILNKKVGWIQGYIERNGRIRDESYFKKMIDELKDIQFQQYEMNLYDNLHVDYYVDNQGNSISSLMCEDCKNASIYPYIFAIAAYDSDYYFDETNDFIKKLLHSKGYGYLIKQSSDMLRGYLDKSIIDSPKCEGMSIPYILTMLSLDRNCTGQELVNCTREYIVKRYVSHVPPFYNLCSSIKVGNVKNIVLTSRVKENEITRLDVTQLDNVNNVTM
ncbi:hypothetical protein K6025_02830 [Ehrlichia sp. JZT12]